MTVTIFGGRNGSNSNSLGRFTLFPGPTMDRPREELTGALARSSSDLRSVAQDEVGIDAEQPLGAQKGNEDGPRRFFCWNKNT